MIKIAKKRKLPKIPKKGEEYTIPVKNRSGKRDVTFRATGKKGFGKYKITKNVPRK